MSIHHLKSIIILRVFINIAKDKVINLNNHLFQTQLVWPGWTIYTAARAYQNNSATNKYHWLIYATVIFSDCIILRFIGYLFEWSCFSTSRHIITIISLIIIITAYTTELAFENSEYEIFFRVLVEIHWTFLIGITV